MNALPDDLPGRLRVQFAVTRVLTRSLRLLGLREWVLQKRWALGRVRRRLFEACGSARYSMPALHQMDRKLDEIIRLEGGVFVEAGGHNGYTQSNTYYLERFRKWSGVLVEPMPEMAAEAKRNRPNAHVVQCALVASDYHDASVEMQFGDLFSTVHGLHGDDTHYVEGGLVLGWRDHRRERVPALSLDSVLDAAGVDAVDLLSLDLEGYEDQALHGLDLARRAPTWVLVEMHDLDEGKARIGAILGDRYVEHQVISPLDVLYRLGESPAIRG